MPPADPAPRSERRYEGLCPAGPSSAIGSRNTIDPLADRSRKLPHIDPTGRQMLISRDAALFGSRLAIREMGDLPDVQLLADPAQTTCSPRCGAAAPITPAEQQMLTATPYRHTHRSSFTGRHRAALVIFAVMRSDGFSDSLRLVAPAHWSHH